MSRQKWFYRLLFSYMPVFFIATSMLIVMLFIVITESTKREVLQSNESLAKLVLQSTDYLARSYQETLIKDLLLDKNISEFLNPMSVTDPVLSPYSSSASLRASMVNNIAIDSIYLFRQHDGKVLSDQTMLHISEFGDQRFLLSQLEQGNGSHWTGQRPYREVLHKEEERLVVSLVHVQEHVPGGVSLIVMNVKQEKFAQLLADLMLPQTSILKLKEPGGELIASNLRDLQWEEKERFILSTMQSSYTGWFISSEIPESNLYGIIYTFAYLWMIAAVTLIVTIGFLWIMYVSKRNYQPIADLMAHIQAMVPQIGDLSKVHNSDEFDVIRSAMNNLIGISDNYNRHSQTYNASNQTRVLNDLLLNVRQINTEEFNCESDKLKFLEGTAPWITAVVELDHFNDFIHNYSIKDQSLLKFVLVKAMEEVSHVHDTPIWNHWMVTDQLTIIFQKNASMDSIQQLCNSYVDWVRKNLPFTITIGLSEHYDQVERFSVEYKAALHALSYKEVIGFNRVISYSEIAGCTIQDTWGGSLQRIVSIAESYRLADKQWERKYEQWLEWQLRTPVSRLELIHLFRTLIDQLLLEISKVSSEWMKIWPEHTLPLMQSLLVQFESVSDLRHQFLIGMKEAAYQYEQVLAARSEVRPIDRIVIYITQNYGNPELSLAMLSEIFQMNANYLSKLIKDEVGDNFVRFLSRLRTERAKQLLAETPESVQEVALQVGYLHSITFIRVFKKEVGCTPGDYRKRGGAGDTPNCST